MIAVAGLKQCDETYKGGKSRINMKTTTGNETWEAKGSQLAGAQRSNNRAQYKCRIIKNQDPCILERNWKRIRQNNVTRVRVKIRSDTGTNFYSELL